MNYQNLKISTRLSLGFGIFLLFVFMLGGLAYYQSNRLWENTRNLYEHPMQVARATRDIKADVLSLNLLINEIVTNESLTNAEYLEIAIHFKTIEKQIDKTFELVQERYLGSKTHIDSVYRAYAHWEALCSELITLSKNGNHEAAKRLYYSAVKPQIKEINEKIQVMIDFARQKGDSFYLAAEQEKKLLFIRLSVFTGVIFILTFFYAYFLIQGIRKPLQTLAVATEEYRKGKYDTRTDYNSTNEIGALATAFNRMAGTVQTEMNLKENASSFSEVMANENDLKVFCQILLKTLLAKTHAQIAAIYFLNTSNDTFEHFDSIGLDAKHIKAFSAVRQEGEFGTVLATKKIQRISQLTENSSFIFSAVTGEFKPREIITIPVVENNTVVGVISLANLHVFPPNAFLFLKEILMALTARLNSVRLFQKITDFSALLDKQNKEMEEKTHELMMQSDELKEYNIELELQKRQLDEANQLKSAFLSNMSHELRTPLNSVIALSGVLSRRLKNSISQDEYSYLGIIEKNGKQLLTLINDILDLSRIEAGKEDLNFSEFSLHSLTQNILDSIEPICHQKGIALLNKINTNLLPIISDSSKCHHILQNIISNAVKFTEKGSIEIYAESTNGYIRITIKDTGIGISSEHIPFIFDEFRQADDKASRRYGGTGLGLAIAKKYTLLLNGTIEVDSEPGIGSVFTLILPITPDKLLHPKPEKEFLPDNPGFSGNTLSPYLPGQKNILVVEDSEPQIIQLTDILKAEGYHISIARNGKEALESIKISIPDAMILDLMMPEVDGFEVLKQIRNLDETRKIPVLILSAKHITKDELSFLIENNVHQLIQKGDINRSDLLGYIRNMIQLPVKAKVKPENQPYKQPQRSGKAHILHIEDNPDNQISVKALLSDKFEITDAADGPEGLQKASHFIPDLILLDISLPGMDGFTVFNELKKDHRLQHVPILALTARAMKGDREKLLEHGFDGYISKPIENEIFENTINEWLYGK